MTRKERVLRYALVVILITLVGIFSYSLVRALTPGIAKLFSRPTELPVPKSYTVFKSDNQLHNFTFEYPADWTLVSSNPPKLDPRVPIKGPRRGKSSASLAIEVLPSDAPKYQRADLNSFLDKERQRLEGLKGFKEVSKGKTSLAGSDALEYTYEVWDVTEGVRMRSIFLMARRSNFYFLGYSSDVRNFKRLYPVYERLKRTFKFKD